MNMPAPAVRIRIIYKSLGPGEGNVHVPGVKNIVTFANSKTF